ncbi:MAG: ABC transporter permease, partial [Clostridia bacterium]|nr:ABC transporter permease [Clostridia bacterium]
MLNLSQTEKFLLNEVADMKDIPTGAFNIRSNSQSVLRQSSKNIEIVSKEGISGIDIFIKPGTKDEQVHIPVVISESGIKEKVYNDFFIGDNADVMIVA